MGRVEGNAAHVSAEDMAEAETVAGRRGRGGGVASP